MPATAGPTGETKMDTYLFEREDGSLVEVVAVSYLAAQKIAGDDAVCIASGADAVVEYDAAYDAVEQA